MRSGLAARKIIKKSLSRFYPTFLKRVWSGSQLKKGKEGKEEEKLGKISMSHGERTK